MRGWRGEREKDGEESGSRMERREGCVQRYVVQYARNVLLQ
jgi:hypothetical protein